MKYSALAPSPYGVHCMALDMVQKPTGFLIISVPDVAHFSVRKMLLKGNFDYEEYGILDKTHLRFFTLKSLKSLLTEAGLRVEVVKYTFALNHSLYHRWYFNLLRRLGLLEGLIQKLGPVFPGLFAYQFLVKAALRRPIYE